MARVLVSSGNLHTQLGAHLGEATVQLRVGGCQCSVWSEAFTNALPCESNWTGVATVGLESLLKALAQIENQPITLDLHEHGNNKLFALRRVRVAHNSPEPFGYESLTFEL